MYFPSMYYCTIVLLYQCIYAIILSWSHNNSNGCTKDMERCRVSLPCLWYLSPHSRYFENGWLLGSTSMSPNTMSPNYLSPFALYLPTDNCTPRPSTWPLRLVCVQSQGLKAYSVFLPTSQPQLLGLCSYRMVQYRMVQYNPQRMREESTLHGIQRLNWTPPSPFLSHHPTHHLGQPRLTLGRLQDGANTQLKWPDVQGNDPELLDEDACTFITHHEEILGCYHYH